MRISESFRDTGGKRGQFFEEVNRDRSNLAQISGKIGAIPESFRDTDVNLF